MRITEQTNDQMLRALLGPIESGSTKVPRRMAAPPLSSGAAAAGEPPPQDGFERGATQQEELISNWASSVTNGIIESLAVCAYAMHLGDAPPDALHQRRYADTPNPEAPRLTISRALMPEAVPPSAPGLAARFLVGLRGFRTWLHERGEFRRAAANLEALDDRMLRDIGLRRDQIQSLAGHSIIFRLEGGDRRFSYRDGTHP
jgi:uncharacterized protein YjiS (DUF1127 family)